MQDRSDLSTHLGRAQRSAVLLRWRLTAPAVGFGALLYIVGWVMAIVSVAQSATAGEAHVGPATGWWAIVPIGAAMGMFAVLPVDVWLVARLHMMWLLIFACCTVSGVVLAAVAFSEACPLASRRSPCNFVGTCLLVYAASCAPATATLVLPSSPTAHPPRAVLMR